MLLHQLRLESRAAAALKNQLDRDAFFLCRQGIMDYSLLVGVHRKAFELTALDPQGDQVQVTPVEGSPSTGTSSPRAIVLETTSQSLPTLDSEREGRRRLRQHSESILQRPVRTRSRESFGPLARSSTTQRVGSVAALVGLRPLHSRAASEEEVEMKPASSSSLTDSPVTGADRLGSCSGITPSRIEAPGRFYLGASAWRAARPQSGRLMYPSCRRHRHVADLDVAQVVGGPVQAPHLVQRPRCVCVCVRVRSLCSPPADCGELVVFRHLRSAAWRLL